jgi:ATP-binding cassette subfamily F protein 3
MQKRLSKVESQIKQLEDDIRKDDRELESNYDKHIENANFFTAYNRKKADLEKLMEEWETVQLDIDNA